METIFFFVFSFHRVPQLSLFFASVRLLTLHFSLTHTRLHTLSSSISNSLSFSFFLNISLSLLLWIYLLVKLTKLLLIYFNSQWFEKSSEYCGCWSWQTIKAKLIDNGPHMCAQNTTVCWSYLSVHRNIDFFSWILLLSSPQWHYKNTVITKNDTWWQ